VQSASTADVPEDWQDRPSWTSTIQVEVRRMTSHDLIAAGATMSVWDSSRNVQRSGLPGTYTVPGGLHRGDSYTAQVHVPEPVGGQLDAADTGQGGQEADDLVLEIPFRKHEGYTFHQIGRGGRGYVRHAEVHFRPFDQGGGYAVFPRPDVSSFHLRRIMRRSKYWRTYQLAMRLRRHAKTPLDYILAVNHYLQHGFAYSEHPPPVAAGHAPLDAFLFDTKEGYCQHFSGAMALLLRMGGIPSRVATGFSPGGYSTRYQAWIVRDTDAHAWVEAWFDNIGWVTYDPTPSETPARSQIFALADTGPSTTRSGASPGALPAGAAGDARRPSNFLRPDLAFDRQAGSSKPGEAAAALRGSGPSFWLWALIVLLAGGAAGAIASLARRRGDARTPLERSVDELDEALRRAGRPQPTGTTLRQLERLFGGSEDAVVYLRALSAARYGPAPDPPTPAQRRRLRRALGDGLGWWGRVRAWWALPPRGR
jgi:hypothetical protein